MATEERAEKQIKVTTKLSKHDYSLICAWLEAPENRSKLEGAEKRVKLGSRPVRPIVKSKTLVELAKFLNDNQNKGSTLKKLTGPSMRTRFKHYFNRYRSTKVESEKTGFGLTDGDRAAGIESVEDKLERLCPSFSRMDSIFGKRPNDSGTGFAKYESGIDCETADLVPAIIAHESNSIDGEEEASDVGGVQAGETDVEFEDTDAELQPDLNSNVQHAIEDGEVDPADAERSTPYVDGDERRRSPGSATASPEIETGAGCSASPQSPSRVNPTSQIAAIPVVSVAADAAGVRRSRPRSSQTLGKEKTYPSKKQVVGSCQSCHSISVAFANNLKALSLQKEKANQLKERKMEMDQQMEERRFDWEKQRYEEERNFERHRCEEERQEKRDFADRAEKSQMKIAVLSSTRPITEIRELLSLLE